jgi:hypothetical protein
VAILTIKIPEAFLPLGSFWLEKLFRNHDKNPLVDPEGYLW